MTRNLSLKIVEYEIEEDPVCSVVDANTDDDIDQISGPRPHDEGRIYRFMKVDRCEVGREPNDLAVICTYSCSFVGMVEIHWNERGILDFLFRHSSAAQIHQANPIFWVRFRHSCW